MNLRRSPQPDTWRRVIQCTCGSAVRWSGEEHAWRHRWRSAWVDGRARHTGRVWTCAECSPVVVMAVAPPPVAPAYALPAELLAEATRRPARAAALLQRLLEVDAPRGLALVGQLLAALRAPGPTSASRWWTRWARGRSELAPLAKARPRRAPAPARAA